MFDESDINEFDFMMKSILDEAREEVPAHVWEGVSAGLDKVARRKAVMLLFRRAGLGVAAAAAVVAGVFFAFDSGEKFVPEAVGEMIAVVEEVGDEGGDMMAVVMDDDVKVTDETMAAGTYDVCRENAVSDNEERVLTNWEEISSDEEMVPENSGTEEARTETVGTTDEPAGYFPESWGEEKVSKKRNVSFVVSGLAGTNNSRKQNRVSPMMRPQAAPAPKKTGIKETSAKSSYGIPLSFGAGVKIDLGKRWAIGTGLNYTFLSRQFYGTYTEVNPDGVIESTTGSDINNRQHYIGVPVNVFYDVISNEKISFYAYAGGAVEKCVLDSYNLVGTSINHKEKVAGVQLSANAGIGVEFMLGKHLGLYIDPSLRYYFNNNQPKSIRTLQPLMLGFELGLRARL